MTDQLYVIYSTSNTGTIKNVRTMETDDDPIDQNAVWSRKFNYAFIALILLMAASMFVAWKMGVYNDILVIENG